MKKITLLFLALFCMFNLHAQINENPCYVFGGANDERAYDIYRMPPLMYPVSGYTNSFGVGEEDFFLPTFHHGDNNDPLLDYFWLDVSGERGITIGEQMIDTAKAGVMSHDGHRVDVGVTGNFGGGMYITKTDISTGDIIWTRIIERSRGEDIIRTPCIEAPNGFTIVGSYLNINDNYDIIIVRLNSEGALLWSSIINNEGYDSYGHAICEIPGAVLPDYAITGYVEETNKDIYIARLSNAGSLIWGYIFENQFLPGDQAGYDIILNSEIHNFEGARTLSVTGYTNTSGAGNDDVIYFRISEHFPLYGLTFPIITVGGPMDERGHAIIESSEINQNAGWVIAGYTNSYGAGVDDVYAVKILAMPDIEGNYLGWTRTYGGENEDRGYGIEHRFKSLAEPNGGGYLFAGYTKSFGHGGDDVYLVLTDINGIACENCYTGTGGIENIMTLIEKESGVSDYITLTTTSGGVQGEGGTSIELCGDEPGDIICPEDTTACLHAEPFQLTGAFPEGGIYSGPGVTMGPGGLDDYLFAPAIAGIGEHTITYRVLLMECTFIISVYLPEVTCPEDMLVCIDDEPFVLTGATPEGGVYSGEGVVDGIFYPGAGGAMGIGSFLITYTYTDADECTNFCTFSITVNDLPEVFCPEEVKMVCVDDEPLDLEGVANPIGGVYSGTGVTDGIFNPSGANIGANVITYTYTDLQTGCVNSCEFTIIVNDLPQVTCPQDITVCADDNPFELTGAMPEGGVYSGPGVGDDGIFNPSEANIGANVITYTYIDLQTGCVNSCEFTVIVNDLPQVTCPQGITVCVNDEPFELTGAEPDGGIYSGEGIIEGFFNPGIVGAGEYTITYTYTDLQTGCENYCEFYIVVFYLPEVNCPEDMYICIDKEEFELSGGYPEGGIYSGEGVSEGMFNPGGVGVGEYLITYTYINPDTGCENSCEFNITVNDLPEVSCPEDFEVTENEPVELTGATPEGGIYSGTSVTGGIFNPDGLANGNYTITYTYTDDNGCSGSCKFVITVNVEGHPDIICPEDIVVCANDELFELTGAMPEGGTYSGMGVSENIFNPEAAGVGEHTIVYTYGEYDCEFIITVNPTPQMECPEDIFVCIDDDEFALTGGLPEGGTYIGPEIVEGIFYPSHVGAGEHPITYTYTDPDTGCENFCTFTITVYDLPEVICPDDMLVCIDDEPFELTGAEPDGGIYSGEGIIDGLFNPGTAGTGEYIITYTYTDLQTGCVNSCDFIIIVNNLPEVSCPQDIVVCIDDAEFELSGGYPEGGTYIGPGIVSVGMFNPEIAGVGEFIIIYIYVDPDTGCENSCEFNITVNDLPEVSCPEDFEVTENESAELTGATPVGGIYSGTGVTDGIFNPDGLANGNYTITYAYTDDNSCTNFCKFVITVNIEGHPDIICPDDMFVCITDEEFELTGALPEGGTYTGVGVNNGIFNPMEAGEGNYEITYALNGYECIFEITVNEIPEMQCPEDIFVCIDDGEIVLTGGLPDDGTYIGPGITNGIFNPSETGAGEFPITYTYTDPETGCENFCTFTITVYDLPEVICPDDMNVFTNDNPFALTGAEPEGGVYSGIGVDDEGVFDPSATGVGTYTITYTYTDPATGCENYCEFIIIVDIVPEVIESKTVEISVYPNPNKGEFFISFGNVNGEINYQIYDIKGSVIVNRNIIIDNNTVQKISVNLVPGVYFLKLVTETQSTVKKLMIE